MKCLCLCTANDWVVVGIFYLKGTLCVVVFMYGIFHKPLFFPTHERDYLSRNLSHKTCVVMFCSTQQDLYFDYLNHSKTTLSINSVGIIIVCPGVS